LQPCASLEIWFSFSIYHADYQTSSGFRLSQPDSYNDLFVKFIIGKLYKSLLADFIKPKIKPKLEKV
jgi:hypothetical protein